RLSRRRRPPASSVGRLVRSSMIRSVQFLAAPLLLVVLAAQAPSPDAAALADVTPPSPHADATTVPGVTVNGKQQPPPKCKPKDEACVIAVAQAVWDKYPEQTKTYCQQER